MRITLNRQNGYHWVHMHPFDRKPLYVVVEGDMPKGILVATDDGEEPPIGIGCEARETGPAIRAVCTRETVPGQHPLVVKNVWILTIDSDEE